MAVLFRIPELRELDHEPASVCACAQSVGIEVAPRSRIAATVMNQYRQAHPSASPVDAI